MMRRSFELTDSVSTLADGFPDRAAAAHMLEVIHAPP